MFTGAEIDLGDAQAQVEVVRLAPGEVTFAGALPTSAATRCPGAAV